jgi:putative component of toxin-antitoxin plasmid stabilization module
MLVQWELIRYHIAHKLPDQETLLDEGDSPFAEWFGSLEAVAAAKVCVAVSRMEQGNLSNVEWLRGLGEYKIDWGPGLRMALWEGYKRRKASTQKGK